MDNIQAPHGLYYGPISIDQILIKEQNNNHRRLSIGYLVGEGFVVGVWMERQMAPRRRFERPTCRLGGGCSIQLSYRGVSTPGAIVGISLPQSNLLNQALTKLWESFCGAVAPSASQSRRPLVWPRRML